MTARARSRLPVHAEAAEGEGESIAIDFTLPFNATLLQWYFRISGVPATDESFTVQKVSPLGNQYTIVLSSVNPYEDQIAMQIENDHWEFLRGDHLLIDYLNTDDIDVAVEAIFAEAD